MTIEKANAIIEQLKKLRDSIDDKAASTAKDLYPTMHYTGEAIQAGKRILWNGKIMKAAVTCWDREDNNPDNAPTLWEELQYKDGYRYIPETITVTSAFALNECGWWKDSLYRSKVNANVYNPEQYPPNWEIVLAE